MNQIVMPMHEGRQLPYINFRQIDLPDILHWEVGQEYYLVLKVKMTGKQSGEELPQDHDRGKVEAQFKVTSVRSMGNKPVDAHAIEQEDFRRTVAKARSGEYMNG